MIRRATLIAWGVLTALVLVAAVLIVAPPATYGLWVAAVYAIEASGLSIVVGLLGVGLALWLARTGGWRTGRWLVAASVLALLGAGAPTLQAIADGWHHDVVLSPGTYLTGLTATAKRTPQTLTYASVDGKQLALDVWRPDGESPARPAVVVVHGGGWEGGQRSDYPLWSSWLADRGYVVFDIDYRLSPPPRWRDAVADVSCAVGWVRDHADDYQVDARRIGLLGRSAGGHLALLAAYAAGEPELPPSCPVHDTTVASVVALYPPADLAYTYDAPVSWRHPPATANQGRHFLRSFTGGTPTQVPDRYRRASPVAHVGSTSPPTLLVQGDWDRLKVPQDTTRLAHALRGAGVRCEYLRLAYADHAFDANWGGWGSQLLRPALARFLEETLRG